MKKSITFLLCLGLSCSLLAGCGTSSTPPDASENASSVQEDQTDQAPAVSAVDSELQAAYDCGFVPEEMQADIERTIQHSELAQMLSAMMETTCPEAVGDWEKIASRALNVNEDMERDDGMLTLYEAACAMGLGVRANPGWLDASSFYAAYKFWDTFSTREDIFSNLHDISPYEDNFGHLAEWDYQTACRFYVCGMSSSACTLPLFSYAENVTAFSSPLTCDEAIRAVYRLKLSYDTRRGGYTLAETDWDDELLSDAAAARDAILASETTITQGDEFVLGETYSGAAYYVSNSGDDANDGLSPETAWATLDKVEQASLAYGDAVFFERGGSWTGMLVMQHGVTYSAYGTGDKPVITGSPEGIADPEKWTVYAETEDGGTIWQYTEHVYDSGIVLFNGGESAARKLMPHWDGNQYVNDDGSAFDFVSELKDLEFFSWLDLGDFSSGYLNEDALREKNTGVLYLRCDAGNPGEIYDQIEFSLFSNSVCTADEGYNAIDNISFRCFSGSAMDCNGNEYILYQNCEGCWAGGGIQAYLPSNNNSYQEALISGGGILLFGNHVTARNNYIHDCENKGIAVVINGNTDLPDKEKVFYRTDILAEENVIARCGSSIYMMMEFIPEGTECKFEDIVIRNNDIIDSGYGWRVENRLQCGSGDGEHMEGIWINHIQPTGEVLISNNMFYRAAGPLIYFGGTDFENGSAMPSLQGNTYVQDADHTLLLKRDEAHDYYRETTLANSKTELMEKCVTEFIGDKEGTVIIR